MQIARRYKSPAFKFERYEYRMLENDPKPRPYELRLINDNLGSSRVSVEELSDPLGLFTVVYEENLATDGDLEGADLFGIRSVPVH